MPVPPFPSRRLAISLWDFSWYTQAGPGEPFHDIDRAFDELVARGFNTVRICAAPFLLFSDKVADPANLIVTGLGARYGQRTRWYNVAGGYRLDLLTRLETLFAAAQRHDCSVILSSWEYQQSPCFVSDDRWFTALASVDGPNRAQLVAAAMAKLIDHLIERNLADPIAYVEIHNEVDNCNLVPAEPGQLAGHYARLSEPLDQARVAFVERHPDIPLTYSLGETWPHEMSALPKSDVAHYHFYVYGVLAAIYAAVGLGHGTEPRPAIDHWPTGALAKMLRPDAPTRDDYQPQAGWQSAATGINRDLFYVHDWVDENKWDLWLYEHYESHRDSMPATLLSWVDSVADFAAMRGIPAVLGEGVVGYTPRLTRFEEDAVGKNLIELTVDRCLERGYAGTVLTSNAAPQHPMWHTDAAWMAQINLRITS